MGDQQTRRRAGHPGLRQGHLRRHVPGQRGAGHRDRRGLADRGRLRPHVHLRRRRARLCRGAQDAGDHLSPRGQVDGALHRRDVHRRTKQDPGHLPRLVHRHPAGRAGHGPGVRASPGRQVRHEAAVRERGLGHLLHARPPRAAVQAGHPADPGAVRGTAGTDRGRHRQGPRRRGRRAAAMTEVPINVSELLTDPAGVQRAEWAARSFARYDKGSVDAIVRAAATAGAAKAREYAEWAVRETGFGVVEHKVIKNVACSTGIVDYYAGHDYVTPRLYPEAKIVEIPRPAGVVFALTPSTNPVATVFFKCLLALMTRSVVVVSPHPMAIQCCADAARTLADAAVKAGAPDGVIQVVDEPSVPLIDALMTDERTSVIVATGGVPVVRASYSSGNPAIGVGPGNVPVLVDATADLAQAARRIVDSKSFDNSVLCTNESVLIVQEQAATALMRQLKHAGAYLLAPEQRDKVASLLFPDGRFDIRFVGRDATWIAAEAGIRVPASTRVLLAPFDLVVPEEPLAHEKLCPVLGLVRVPSARRGIDAARAVLRLSGRGHSAAIHSADPRVIMEYGAAVEVLRVAVNVGNSLGSAGLETNLAPTMTIGTGFFGRSSVAENLHPSHLVQWTRLAYNSDRAEPFGDFTGLIPWQAPAGPVPAYPVASNQRDSGPGPGTHGPAAGTTIRSEKIQWQPDAAALREEIRRMVIEELAQLVRG